MLTKNEAVRKVDKPNREDWLAKPTTEEEAKQLLDLEVDARQVPDIPVDAIKETFGKPVILWDVEEGNDKVYEVINKGVKS
jgi:hypothetical protein